MSLQQRGKWLDEGRKRVWKLPPAKLPMRARALAAAGTRPSRVKTHQQFLLEVERKVQLWFNTGCHWRMLPKDVLDFTKIQCSYTF